MERIEKFGYTHLDINPGMWVFPRNFCSKAKQNALSRMHSLLLDFQTLRENPKLLGDNHDPCTICPIAKYCRWVFPSELYYRFGRLVPIERFDRFESDQLIAYPELPPEVSFKLLIKKFLTRDGNGHAVAPKKETSTKQISLFADP
jgi:hypothetical protein